MDRNFDLSTKRGITMQQALQQKLSNLTIILVACTIKLAIEAKTKVTPTS